MVKQKIKTIKKVSRKKKKMSDHETVDLKKINKPKVSHHVKKVAHHVKKGANHVKHKISKKHQPGRDENGKFTVGHGGHIHKKKFNWHFGIAVSLVVAIIGGLFIFKAFASDKAVNPRDANAVVTCAYETFLNRKPDPKGAAFWRQRYIESKYNAEKLGASLLNSKEGQFVAYVYPFDNFIQRLYRSCTRKAAPANDIKIWTNHHLKGLSRPAIFNFVLQVGHNPNLFTPKESVCKQYYKGGSVKPVCKPNSAGTHLDVVTTKLPESNIVVNKAWADNVSRVKFAAARSRFYLEAYQDPRVPYPAGSYRSEAAQQWLRSHGYPAARGVSMHQWGLAIDFKCNGVPLNRNAACLNWMKANAPRYGLYMLSYEPWHWSSNGR